MMASTIPVRITSRNSKNNTLWYNGFDRYQLELLLEILEVSRTKIEVTLVI